GQSRGGRSMSAVLTARGLGKRYRRRWALSDCTLAVPPGHVTGLVGPNGAGKTTLLHLATGLLAPTCGTVETLGGPPASGPDPLARREFLQILMEAVAEQEISVILSSHLVADLERVCDYLIVLIASRIQLAGQVEDLLAAHHLLTGPHRDPATLPQDVAVVHA